MASNKQDITVNYHKRFGAGEIKDPVIVVSQDQVTLKPVYWNFTLMMNMIFTLLLVYAVLQPKEAHFTAAFICLL